jgi:hypothetical protein
MAKLKKNQKEFIVKQLAMFESASTIAEKVKEKYDLELALPQLSYYNPKSNGQSSRQLSTKWVHLFNTTRQRFLEGAIQIPIANKHYRLRELQKNYKKLLADKNISGANQVLEQAAKEMGGAYGAPVVLDQSTSNFYQQVNNRILKQNNKN